MKGTWLAVPLICFLACSNRQSDVGQSAEAVQKTPNPYVDPIRAALESPPSDQWTAADEAVLTPVYVGNDDQGAMLVPQWRGSGTGIEEYVYAPPNHDCTHLKGTVRVDWDSSKNSVRVVAKYRGLTPHPSVSRTEGVDYFPNPFHDFPKDFSDGTYRLWVILEATTRSATLYYDPQTLDLLGSEFDFPSGPPNGGAVIPVKIPAFVLSGSGSFDPDSSGFGFVDYTFPYDDLEVQGGAFSVAYISYAPFNLCNGIAAAPARGQLRPVVGPWELPGQNISWKTALAAAVGFDLQLEKRGDATMQGNLPYIYGGVAYIGNGPGVQGGIPPGYGPSIPAQIQNVAPVIMPIPGNQSASCQPYLFDPHITAPNFCGQ